MIVDCSYPLATMLCKLMLLICVQSQIEEELGQNRVRNGSEADQRWPEQVRSEVESSVYTYILCSESEK